MMQMSFTLISEQGKFPTDYFNVSSGRSSVFKQTVNRLDYNFYAQTLDFQ